MKLRTALAAMVGTFVLCATTLATAQRLPDDLPDELRPWTAWVLHDTPDIVCPDVDGVRTCRWPGTLNVSATTTGAAFEMEVFADRETLFALPGNQEFWPQDVRVDLRTATVVARGDEAFVRVPSGSHRISGAFAWSQIPEVLAVPNNVARVELRLDGSSVPRPRIGADGRLWLRDGTSEGSGESETDSVRASIYRRFEDGVPMHVTTRIRLNVSGRAREVDLGNVLVAGSRPVEVRASIPVQVGIDGQATVYVRPGTHDLEIDAVVASKVAQVAAPTPEPNFYDPQEVWIWSPDESVRSVQLGGLTAVDPERTSLPPEWKGYTTFLAAPGKALTLDVTRRGVEEPQPNTVRLQRDLWLDLDGTGYTVRDQVSGTMHQDWRLDYSTAGGAALGRVSRGGENLLITKEPGTGLPGVELRESNLNLTAEVRIEDARSQLAIVGWDHDVQQLGANLHLPPGWTLLGGDGVDTMSGTWMSSWTLWDFFFVLIIALVVGKLFGWPWAGVSFLALIVAHSQEGAPEWVWIHLVASLALLRVLPQSWIRKAVVLYRSAALIALVLILAPFAHDQVLVSLHPQVSMAQTHTAAFSPAFSDSRLLEDEVAKPSPAMELEGNSEFVPEPQMKDDDGRFAQKKGGKGLWRASGSGDAGEYKQQIQQVDPSAVVQTGPGLPTWNWSSWSLQWTGPVRKDNAVKFYLLSPGANRALGLLRVLLLLALALLLLAPRDMYWEEQKRVPTWWRRLFGTGLATLIAVGLMQIVAAAPAYAQNTDEPPFPEQVQSQSLGNIGFDGGPAGPGSEMLSELRRRIISKSECPAPCVVASSASIAVDGLELEMTADVSAARDSGWTLPGPMDALRIESIRVDGRPTTQLRRDANGMTTVRLSEGPHTIQVVGTLADRNVVTIQFDEVTRPRYVTFAASAWTVDGISPTGVPDNSLQLTRTVDTSTEPEDAASGAVALPPWYQVQRLVALGMPWQIHTTVSRRDSTRPQLVKIPLIAGEKVISEGIRVEGRDALVDFGRDQASVTFVSEIAIAETIELTAAKDVPWTETWRVDCSRIWRCDFSNLPPVTIAENGSWLPVWRPWPGESLEITVRKPGGAEGQPKTVQDVTYTVTPGKRLMQADLAMSIRASQGGWQEVTIPPEAELQSVSIGGENRAIRPQDGVVRIPVQPGENAVSLRWQQPWKRTVVERVPEIDIGSDAANATITIQRGGDRWLLAVRDGGLSWGPAILFWPHLLILVLLAMLLSFVPHVPVKWHEWLLLAIGLSQLPVVVMLPVVFWFVLLAWRRRNLLEPWWKFDAVQLGIVLLTVIALGALYAAIHTNLLIDVDMQVDGRGSSNTRLNWYADRVGSTLPTPAILSLPLLVWRGLMFLWALWLVTRLIGWAKWGWECFSQSGRWKFPNPRPREKRPAADGTPGRSGSRREPAVKLDPGSVERNAKDGELVHVEIPLGARSSAEQRSKDADITAEVEVEWDDDEDDESASVNIRRADHVVETDDRADSSADATVEEPVFRRDPQSDDGPPESDPQDELVKESEGGSVVRPNGDEEE